MPKPGWCSSDLLNTVISELEFIHLKPALEIHRFLFCSCLFPEARHLKSEKMNNYEINAYNINYSSSHTHKSETHHGSRITNSRAFSVDLQKDILNIRLFIPRISVEKKEIHDNGARGLLSGFRSG